MDTFRTFRKKPASRSKPWSTSTSESVPPAERSSRLLGDWLSQKALPSVVSRKNLYKTSFPLVMLSEAKHLLLLEHIGDKQILR